MTCSAMKGLLRTQCLRGSLPGSLLSVAVALVSLLSSQIAHAAVATLAWDANAEEDLAGYRVFQREEGQAYNYGQPAWEGLLDQLQDPDEPKCTVGGLSDGVTYCFVARAFDTEGLESLDSNEVCGQPTAIIAGDVDGSGIADAADAVSVLQVLTGANAGGAHFDADANGDGEIGLEDAVYILQKMAALR